MRKADKALSSKWEATLRHEGLSMHRGSNISKRKKLTYVDPSDLDALPDAASDPEKILLAKEKVKFVDIGYKTGDYWITKRVKIDKP